MPSSSAAVGRRRRRRWPRVLGRRPRLAAAAKVVSAWPRCRRGSALSSWAFKCVLLRCVCARAVHTAAQAIHAGTLASRRRRRPLMIIIVKVEIEARRGRRLASKRPRWRHFHTTCMILRRCNERPATAAPPHTRRASFTRGRRGSPNRGASLESRNRQSDRAVFFQTRLLLRLASLAHVLHCGRIDDPTDLHTGIETQRTTQGQPSFQLDSSPLSRPSPGIIMEQQPHRVRTRRSMVDGRCSTAVVKAPCKKSGAAVLSAVRRARRGALVGFVGTRKECPCVLRALASLGSLSGSLYVSPHP